MTRHKLSPSVFARIGTHTVVTLKITFEVNFDVESHVKFIPTYLREFPLRYCFCICNKNDRIIKNRKEQAFKSANQNPPEKSDNLEMNLDEYNKI